MDRKQNVLLAWALLTALIFLPACSALMKPPLIKAVDEGKDKEVERLLAQGTDPNASNQKRG